MDESTEGESAERADVAAVELERATRDEEPESWLLVGLTKPNHDQKFRAVEELNQAMRCETVALQVDPPRQLWGWVTARSVQTMSAGQARILAGGLRDPMARIGIAAEMSLKPRLGPGWNSDARARPLE